ncbi:MAG: hypothetical protein ACJ74Q_15280 [Pyrinomonadaceae bacterium]
MTEQAQTQGGDGEELTGARRRLALAALRGVLDPSAHTTNCTELRAYGVRKCTKVCGRVREAIGKLTGDAVPGGDWPGPRAEQLSVPDLCRYCGASFNFVGGYCPQCGEPFLPADREEHAALSNVKREQLFHDEIEQMTILEERSHPDTNLSPTLLVVDELEETFLNLDRDQLLSILPTVLRWLGVVEPSFQATTLFTIDARVRRQGSEEVGVVRHINIGINANGRSVIYKVDFGGEVETVNEAELERAGGPSPEEYTA